MDLAAGIHVNFGRSIICHRLLHDLNDMILDDIDVRAKYCKLVHPNRIPFFVRNLKFQLDVPFMYGHL